MLYLLKAKAAKTPRFCLQITPEWTAQQPKITGGESHNNNFERILQPKTGQETKITSLALVWQGTVLQIEEYLIIFDVFFSPYGRERSLSTSSSSVQSPFASKRRKRNAFFFKRETWTHEFLCLADKSQMAVPSRANFSRLALKGRHWKYHTIYIHMEYRIGTGAGGGGGLLTGTWFGEVS